MKILNTNTKEILMQMINKVIDDNKWSSKKAAHILDTPLADVSRIKNSQTANFYIGKTVDFFSEVKLQGNNYYK